MPRTAKPHRQAGPGQGEKKMVEETDGLKTIRRGIVFTAVFLVFLIILLDVGKLQAVLFISTIAPAEALRIALILRRQDRIPRGALRQLQGRERRCRA